jgi:hypothetical protein
MTFAPDAAANDAATRPAAPAPTTTTVINLSNLPPLDTVATPGVVKGHARLREWLREKARRSLRG